jgi:hypothetical protein
MKAILEFDLDNEDDFQSYNLCNNASKMYLVLWEFDQKLRGMCKYEDNEEACEIRELLYEYLNEHNIKL